MREETGKTDRCGPISLLPESWGCRPKFLPHLFPYKLVGNYSLGSRKGLDLLWVSWRLFVLARLCSVDKKLMP